MIDHGRMKKADSFWSAARLKKMGRNCAIVQDPEPRRKPQLARVSSDRSNLRVPESGQFLVRGKIEKDGPKLRDRARSWAAA